MSDPRDLTFSCACCFEPNEFRYDPAEGDEQEYVIDCAVCCRPNVITVRRDHRTGRVELNNYQEDIG